MQHTNNFKSINIRTVCDMVIEMLSTFSAINKIMLKYGIADVYPEQPAGPGGHKTNQTAVELANRICQNANPTYFKELFQDKVGEVSITALRATKQHFVPLIQQYKESLQDTDAITSTIGILYRDRFDPSNAFLTKLNLSEDCTSKEKEKMSETKSMDKTMNICTLIKLRAMCSTLKSLSAFAENSYMVHETKYSQHASVNDVNWAARPVFHGGPVIQGAPSFAFAARPETGDNPFKDLQFTESQLDQVQAKLNEISAILFKN